jgi:hypothetical protein
VVGALLLARTVHALYAADTGLAIDGVSALWVDGPRIENEAERDALHRSVLAAVQAIPDVEGAGLDVHGPHGSRLMGSIGLPETPDAELARAQMIPVTPGWFGLLGMQPVNGRTFRDTDWRVGAQAGVVLTASLARRLFGHEQVAGRHVRAGFRDPVELEVAGVVADFSTAWAPDEPEDAFFVTWADASTLGYAADRFTLLTRTRAFDASVAERVRRAVETILPDVPIPDPEPLSARVGDIHEERRLFSRLLGLLSAVAVVLAAVGLYGVAAFGVAGRRREFGVRMALGAEAARLARIVLADAAVLVTAGTALGLGGAWVLSEALRSRLFGVAPLDPASWLGAALLLAAVAAVACWIPAWRAMRVDPAVTLRDE